MLRKELFGIPIGMWVLSALYALVCILLRAFYIDYEGVRQIAAVAEGFSRESTTWWSGHSVLGVALVWLLTLPLRFLPLVDAAQILSALAIGASGLALFRILRLVGLSMGLSGWLAFLFYASNVAWVSATMLPVASLALLLTAWWGLSAIRWLARRELDATGSAQLGVLGGVLALVNLFSLIPVAAAGIVALRRGGGAGLLGTAIGVTLIGYLAVYFAVLPAQVEVGGAVRPKPTLTEWLWTGEGASYVDIPRYSSTYWQSLGEQAQNCLLALGRPFRVRDVYQYYLSGTFITLIKGAFLLMGVIAVIVLLVIRFAGERVATDRLVDAARGVGGFTLLLSLVVILAWQGDRQAMYLWTLFWALVGLGGWLGSYYEEDARRIGYIAPPLVITMLVFGLMKAADLRSIEHDGERQEAEAVSTGVREGDTLIAATRLAEWLRYYTAGKAQVIDSSCWLQPETDFQSLLQGVKQGSGRIILWDYALAPEVYQRANLIYNAQWLESLGKAQQQARDAGGAYLRRYANLVIYPTLFLQPQGEVQTFGAPRN
ncbi:MAG: hypothetical protein KatS3mg017_0604 [Fimbriimonadales bacterium]|nr:MAG: hypothetical protein KatS3mg017_0604 [Fimbriimonadales bacterium]GIV09496.1 MAG: hypothetical protein KatS3mg019_1587 [Fimbriimonadales bacterium]GIV11680.1 MAG: hypothetical protein KatS3mg020_1171 [Fimbriimonadales bacterium]